MINTINLSANGKIDRNSISLRINRVWWLKFFFHPNAFVLSQLFAHTMSISGQLLSFVSVGYERYHTVSNPFDKEKVRRITHFLISICWILAIALSLLQLFFAPETIDFALCEHLSNGNNNNGIIYIMWPFGIFCFLLVAFFYGRIVWLVRKHCKNVNTIYRKMPTTLSGLVILNSEI